ncbi:MAG: hypothetical protein RLZZ15_1866 [Verrucomicrobiota bacterium]|jgi:hypothetical protein
MPHATVRLTVAEKRQFAAAARRNGQTLSDYLRTAARRDTGRVDWAGFFASLPPVKPVRNAATDLSTREGFGN